MDLDEATAQYWDVKRAYNGRDENMTIERALDMLQEVLTVTGPQHPLAEQVIKLQTAIIHGD
jgi:hypothetical protein